MCDEGRPVCRLCTMSERDCSFASQTPEDSISGSEEQLISPGSSSGSVPIATPPSTQDPTSDEPVNVNHMELLIHATLDKDLFNLGDRIADYPSGLAFALKVGLEAPYVMHQLLAFSARHLAHLHPERSAHYLHQAVTLQTQAVSLFNAAQPEVDRSNCVAIVLFSVALGHHVLADTLSKREPGGLDAFVTQCVQCIEMNRGIYTIVHAAWPLLLESELEPVLSLSAGFTSQPPRGDHCERVKELISSTDGLCEADKEVCRQVIQYLQIGFDAVLAEEEQGNRYQMLFTWTMLAPPEFTRLLAAKRPEVFVVLGYYALLLHCGKGMWQVGDSGAYMLGLIEDYLGPEWDYWLEHPRRIVAKDLS
ncbi:hypothetical protein FZEAL_3642 [Fusarium zealandicum]|uniref:Zn(2)-C6 fungal-type domain-containing protein n=1 Tax=Fusarium zealandicum TaxID=1053134 RepID=A0A8H4UNX7_9HYPO|nr:hypothetical protein FZEAL_3642 [Fusarium zealandicum]